MQHLDVELAHRLIRGQLGPQVQADCRRHLRDCPRCRDLVAGERSFMKMLELGDTTPASETPGSCGVAQRTTYLPVLDARGRRRALLKQLSGLVVIAVLALSLSWQLSQGGVMERADVQNLRIPAERQSRTVANLDALIILAHDPWLADQYEDIRTFEQLLIGSKP